MRSKGSNNEKSGGEAVKNTEGRKETHCWVAFNQWGLVGIRGDWRGVQSSGMRSYLLGAVFPSIVLRVSEKTGRSVGGNSSRCRPKGTAEGMR